MMPKIFLLKLVVLMTASFSVWASTDISACRIAKAPVEYPDGLIVPVDLQTQVKAYRGKWLALCSGDRTLLPELLERSDNLAEKFDNIYFKDVSGSEDIREEQILALQKFIPAFDASTGEISGAWTNLESFNEARNLGQLEDQIFFEQFMKIEGDSWLSPWTEQTWDYGGCKRYGDYPWVETLKTFESLQSKLTLSIYKKKATDLENGLLEDEFPVAGNNAIGSQHEVLKDHICACTNQGKESVVKDMQDIASYFKTSTRYKRYEPNMEALIEKVRRNEIVLKSEEEAQCSGG